MCGMKNHPMALAGVLGLALTACGGDGGGGVGSDVEGAGGRVIATCDSILGGTVQATPCAGCTIDGATNVADDDGYTYATVDVPQSGPSAGATLRVTAPEGVTFPADQDTGVFLTEPQGGQVQVNAGRDIELRTYLDGVPQETDAVNNRRRSVPSSDPDVPATFVSFHTLREFDAVEVVISNSGAALSEPHTWKVHELCSHGWVYDPGD